MLRFGVAKKASRDLLMALPRFGVRRGSLVESAGVFEGVAGVGFTFFAERCSFLAGSSFSLSDVSWTVSSLRFLPSTRDDASLLRTRRMVPVDTGPGDETLADVANMCSYYKRCRLTKVDFPARLERE
jgi:hypothetical protein